MKDISTHTWDIYIQPGSQLCRSSFERLENKRKQGRTKHWSSGAMLLTPELNYTAKKDMVIESEARWQMDSKRFAKSRTMRSMTLLPQTSRSLHVVPGEIDVRDYSRPEARYKTVERIIQKDVSVTTVIRTRNGVNATSAKLLLTSFDFLNRFDKKVTMIWPWN